MDNPITFLDHLQHWFASIASVEIVVSDDPRIEANSNLWYISMSREMASNLSEQGVLNCVTDYISAKREESERRQIPPLLFYLWFDEMAGRLCFSLTSITNPTHLDFSCAIRPKAELRDIISQVLSSKYLDGIPFEELSPESIDTPDLNCHQQKPLDVYVTML